MFKQRTARGKEVSHADIGKGKGKVDRRAILQEDRQDEALSREHPEEARIAETKVG